MNKVKKILSLVLGVAMAISMMAVPALAATGTISGDCKLLLPSEGTIKVDYQLKDTDGNDVTEGVTYSITSEDANLSSYANIDSATGELYIGTQAAGKTFTVTATSASVTGSLVVTAAAGYSTDFEDEILDATVANSMFVTGTTAKVVTEGTMEALPSGTPDSTKTNKIAQAYYYGTKYSDTATRLVIKPSDLNAKKLTIEAKGGVLNTSECGYLPATSYPISVSYTDPEGTSTPDSVQAYFENFGEVDSNGQPVALRIYKNASSTGASSRVQKIGYCYELIPTKLVLENNNTVSAYINGVLRTSQHQFSTVNTSDFLVNEITFGSYVDDIEIYSGEKVSGGYEIVGDSYICRAPEGTSANIKYTAEPSLPWAEEDPSLYLALKAAHSGVSVSGMTVTVAGNATAGDFVLQLKNAAGNVVGEKTVTIVGSVYKYAKYPDRYFVDFENQTAGGEINLNTAGQSGSKKDFGLLVAGSGKEPKPTIKANGENLYYSAQGRSNFTVGSTGALSLNADNNAYKMEGVTCGTFEADLMAESALLSEADTEYSLFTEISADRSSGLDIRYDDLGDGSIVIYSYTDDDGHGNWDYRYRKTLAVVPADTWFNFRIEADFVNKTYDLYINNRKVVNDAKHDMGVIGTVWFGVAIDNVAVYHGSKVASEVSGTELRVSGVKQDGFAYNTNISVSGTGNKAVAIQLSDAVTGLDSNSKVIVAQYNSDNQMKSCTTGAIKLDGGVALACSVLDTEVEQGDYFKVFLWNFEKLVPLR